MFQLPFSKYVDYKSSHEIKELKYGPALLSAVSIWTMSAFLNICNHILSTTKLVLWEMANTKSKRFLYSYNTKIFFVINLYSVLWYFTSPYTKLERLFLYLILHIRSLQMSTGSMQMNSSYLTLKRGRFSWDSTTINADINLILIGSTMYQTCDTKLSTSLT